MRRFQIKFRYFSFDGCFFVHLYPIQVVSDTSFPVLTIYSTYLTCSHISLRIIFIRFFLVLSFSRIFLISPIFSTQFSIFFFSTRSNRLNLFSLVFTGLYSAVFRWTAKTRITVLPLKHENLEDLLSGQSTFKLRRKIYVLERWKIACKHVLERGLCTCIGRRSTNCVY